MLDYRRFKEINELFASGHAEEARRLLMELQSRCIALKDERDRLKLRLHSFEDVLHISSNLFMENGLYWLRLPDSVKQGPFCPQCYDSEGGLIRLERDRGALLCAYCGSRYKSSLHILNGLEDMSASHKAHILPFAN